MSLITLEISIITVKKKKIQYQKDPLQFSSQPPLEFFANGSSLLVSPLESILFAAVREIEDTQIITGNRKGLRTSEI